MRNPASFNRARLIVFASSCALGAVGLAHAQTAPAPAPDDSLTWHGITLYGTIDIGLQYETHGAPFSDYYTPASKNIVQKYSREGVFGATGSNEGQTKLGLKGREPLGVGDWSGVFAAETVAPDSTDVVMVDIDDDGDLDALFATATGVVWLAR